MKCYWLLCLPVCCAIFCSGVPHAASQEVPEHTAITFYEGPQTCITCHEGPALGMHSSMHYQWTGPTPFATNIPGTAGKADRGFNTYCGTPITSRRIACWTCHVGNGRVPTPEVSYDQLSNIDCMMCHHELYERRAMPYSPQADLNTDFTVDLRDYARLAANWLRGDCSVFEGCQRTDIDGDGDVTSADLATMAAQWLLSTAFETVAYVDYLGVTHTWTLPQEDAQGNFQFVPNEAAMPISIVQAARTVHSPTRATCLRCHAYAAGTDCGKRGDLGTDYIDPPADVSIHMSPQGLDFACQRCHTSENHHVLGRGLDLRPSDIPEIMTCTSGGCHSTSPHSNTRLDLHTERLACQSCHIPSFARLRATEIARNWLDPFWAQGLYGGQGGYKPEEIRAMDLIPSYRWYDGTSEVYALGQPAVQQNAAGQYEMGTPSGDVATLGARIHPMKEHISNSARHDATGQLIPHSTSTYFFTGDFSLAVAEGMEQVGLDGTWTLVPVHTYQTINHGVVPTPNALECGQCHASLAGGPVRLDLQGELGYTLKGPLTVICSQCHGYEDSEGFRNTHNKHVTDKEFDCSWCHTFSRPERGLTMP